MQSSTFIYNALVEQTQRYFFKFLCNFFFIILHPSNVDICLTCLQNRNRVKDGASKLMVAGVRVGRDGLEDWG